MKLIAELKTSSSCEEMAGRRFKPRKIGSTRTVDVRKHFFSQSVVDSCNALPSEMVSSENFAEFIDTLDTFLNI